MTPPEFLNGPSVASSARLEALTVEATLLRCTCGNPDAHRGEICPQARIEPRGVVGQWRRAESIRARLSMFIGR